MWEGGGAEGRLADWQPVALNFSQPNSSANRSSFPSNMSHADLSLLLANSCMQIEHLVATPTHTHTSVTHTLFVAPSAGFDKLVALLTLLRLMRELSV